jgi:hypothetical protein
MASGLPSEDASGSGGAIGGTVKLGAALVQRIDFAIEDLIELKKVAERHGCLPR